MEGLKTIFLAHFTEGNVKDLSTFQKCDRAQNYITGKLCCEKGNFQHFNTTVCRVWSCVAVYGRAPFSLPV